jgi:uncharacterized coiled-coil protein SlyX
MVALVVVIVVLAAGSGYYYIQASGTINSLNQTVVSQSGKISAEAAQIATDNSMISNLTAKANSLTAQITADEAKIASITQGYKSANQTIVSLNAQITTLNTQLAAANSQISSLNSQVAFLQAITGLTVSKVLLSSQSISTGSTGAVTVVTFTMNYSGYVSVKATAASDGANTGPEILNTFSSSVNSPTFSGIYIPGRGAFYPFGSSVPSTVPFPVAPGTVTVYLVTADLTAQTATLAVTVYY